MKHALRVFSADPENVLNRVEDNFEDGSIRDVAEREAKRRNASLRDKVTDVIARPAADGIAHSPRRFLACFVLARLHEVDDCGHDVGLHDSGNLLAVARGNVGDGPADFFADGLLPTTY